MEIDVNKVLIEYDKIILELQRKVVLLKVENDELKEMLSRKETEDA